MAVGCWRSPTRRPGPQRAPVWATGTCRQHWSQKLCWVPGVGCPLGSGPPRSFPIAPKKPRGLWPAPAQQAAGGPEGSPGSRGPRSARGAHARSFCIRLRRLVACELSRGLGPPLAGQVSNRAVAARTERPPTPLPTHRDPSGQNGTSSPASPGSRGVRPPRCPATEGSPPSVPGAAAGSRGAALSRPAEGRGPSAPSGREPRGRGGAPHPAVCVRGGRADLGGRGRRQRVSSPGEPAAPSVRQSPKSPVGPGWPRGVSFRQTLPSRGLQAIGGLRGPGGRSRERGRWL